LLTVLWPERLVHSSKPSSLNRVVRLETQPEELRSGLYYLGEGFSTESLLQPVITMSAVSYLQVVVSAIVTVFQVELVPKVQLQPVARFRWKKKNKILVREEVTLRQVSNRMGKADETLTGDAFSSTPN